MYWMLRTLLGSYLYIVVIVTPIVAVSFFSKTGNTPHIMARHWAQFTLACANTTVDVQGQENLPAGPAIYMANHSSFFDVFAVLGKLDVQFRWIVKKELFKIPLFGLAMKRVGYLSIDRGNHDKAMQSMQLAADKIRAGTSIMMFPEGTRSSDGSLAYPFKKGGFHLALKAGVPIVPIAITGSRDILPKHGMRISPGTITLAIDKPVYPEGHDAASFSEAVYRALKNGLQDA
jgi:1-acyl-sn-glycerol-3-phosphate acyltransferase